MKSLLSVLVLALVALTGCATVGEGPGGRNITMVSAFPGDARAYAQTAAFADGSRALAASGTGGFASHCESNGACTQISVMPSWAAGGYLLPNAATGPGRQAQAFADAVESAPMTQGALPTGVGTDPTLAGTVDKLGRRVEGLEGRMEGIDGDLDVVLDGHRVAPTEPIKK